MLVVINGPESITKTFIARNVTNVLNKLDRYQMDTVVVDYTSTPFVARDAAGNIIHKQGDTDVEGITSLQAGNADDEAVKKRIEDFYDMLIDVNRAGSLADSFANYARDYNIGSDKDKDDGAFENSYDDVIEWYNNRQLAHVAIYGSFCKTFTDALANDLGSSEVVVVNITRNPSVVFQLYGVEDPLQTTPDRMFSSIINTVTQKRNSKAVTVQYENYLRDGFFKFNSITIPLPEELSSYNNIIENAELELLLNDENKKVAEVVEFNNSSRNPAKLFGVSQLPSDIFTDLGYAPLTYEETVASP